MHKSSSFKGILIWKVNSLILKYLMELEIGNIFDILTHIYEPLSVGPVT